MEKSRLPIFRSTYFRFSDFQEDEERVRSMGMCP